MAESMIELRRRVCTANRALPKQQLVVMHSGNASGYEPESGRIVIKPSGMDYDEITPENLVEVDVASGEIIGASLRPSVDLPHHLFLYRNLPGVRGIVHTHSNHATAFAACLEPIPLCLTAIADEFGGPIPCAPYVSNEGDEIGRAILMHKTDSPAILLGNHGVFTWGDSVEAALKAAVMVEDVAKTLILARQLGVPRQLTSSEAAVWHERYATRYGQKRAA